MQKNEKEGRKERRKEGEKKKSLWRKESPFQTDTHENQDALKFHCVKFWVAFFFIPVLIILEEP